MLWIGSILCFFSYTLTVINDPNADRDYVSGKNASAGLYTLSVTVVPWRRSSTGCYNNCMLFLLSSEQLAGLLTIVNHSF